MGYTPVYLLVTRDSTTQSTASTGYATTNKLKLMGSTADTNQYIIIGGAADIEISASLAVYCKSAGVHSINIQKSGTTNIIKSTVANDDIYLNPNGGVVQFGTYTVGAATDSTGYITIKDAAGNTRKLMVQA